MKLSTAILFAIGALANYGLWTSIDAATAVSFALVAIVSFGIIAIKRSP